MKNSSNHTLITILVLSMLTAIFLWAWEVRQNEINRQAETMCWETLESCKQTLQSCGRLVDELYWRVGQ